MENIRSELSKIEEMCCGIRVIQVRTGSISRPRMPRNKDACARTKKTTGRLQLKKKDVLEMCSAKRSPQDISVKHKCLFTHTHTHTHTHTRGLTWYCWVWTCAGRQVGETAQTRGCRGSPRCCRCTPLGGSRGLFLHHCMQDSTLQVNKTPHDNKAELCRFYILLV